MLKKLLGAFLVLFLIACGGEEAVKKEVPQEPVQKVEEKVEEQVVQKQNEMPAFNFQEAIKNQKFMIFVFHFKTGKWDLPKDAQEFINEAADKINGLIALMKENAVEDKLVIDIYGYADPRGNFEANKVLSTKRAQAVKDALLPLVKGNVEFKVTGFGSAELYVSEDPNHSKNRRAVILLN